jgi:hypothetical protein
MILYPFDYLIHIDDLKKKIKEIKTTKIKKD